MAIQQSDISNRDMKVYEVVNKLKKFGVSKNKYYDLKKGIFTPHSLAKTQQNEQQIKRMAIACNHDPVPLQELILSK
jgi:ACT domain-containing protein